MSTISAQEVNKLRNMTGAGMMDCKKALTEADGDFEKAIEHLRKKGQKVSASRSDRDVKEGAIIVKVSEDKKLAVLVALNCETDFVAKNSEFQKLGVTIAETAISTESENIELLLLEKEKTLTIQEQITEMIGKMGEKIKVTQYELMKGETIVPYIHTGGKLGVLVSLKEGSENPNIEEIGKDIGMQIAAMNPVAIDEKSVDKSTIDKELEIAKAQILEEGKPADLVERIALGKLKKFFKESTLLNQSFVKDNSKSVGQYLDGVAKGLTVVAFKRITIG